MQLTGKVFTLIFCGVLLASIFTGKLPLILAGLYIVMSIVTFIAYAIDKSAAQNNRWRTKESTLHLFAVIGGWPGAFFAQNMLRHKSSKKAFKNVYAATVLMKDPAPRVSLRRNLLRKEGYPISSKVKSFTPQAAGN